MPVICDVGYEAWRAKEAKLADAPGWGDVKNRGPMWVFEGKAYIDGELASEAETLDEIPQEPVEEEVPPTETPPEPEPPSAPPPPVSGRRKRIDLSSVKVMKASTGDFLEEKEDEE